LQVEVQVARQLTLPHTAVVAAVRVVLFIKLLVQ
jgi:hypothetical protein